MLKAVQSEYALVLASLLLALSSLLALLQDSAHIRAMLEQNARQSEINLAEFGFGASSIFSFFSKFVSQHAAVAGVLFLASLFVLLVFAVISAIKSIKRLGARIELANGRSLHGAFRFAIGAAVAAASLAIGPLMTLNVTLSDAEKSYSQIEKDQAQVWAAADRKSSEALVDSLEAQTKRTQHLIVKMRAEMACRGSSSARTYYEGNGYAVEAGYYNSCRLAEFLERTDYMTKEDDSSATYVMNAASRATENALQALNAYKENAKAVSALSQGIRIAQMLLGGFVLVSIAGPLLLGTSRRVVTKASLAGIRQAAIAGQALLAGRKCPKCAERIKAEALVCKHCGSNLS